MGDSDHGSTPPVSGPARGGGPDPGRIVLAVNSVIAAVGGTFTATHSIAATAVAGCAGLVCGVVITWKR
jgi:hypothetical protein